MWERIYENTGVGVAVARDDRLELVNPCFAELFGYAVDEMIGMSVVDLHAPENRKRIPDWIRRINREGSYDFELDLVRADGSRFPAITRARVIDESRRRVVTVMDTTETRRFEQTARELEEIRRSLTESSRDAIMMLDTDGTIRYINREFHDLSPEQVRGRSVFEFASESGKAAARACFDEVLATGEPGQFETQYEADDGNVRHFESRVGPMFGDGSVRAFMVTARDVTASKKTEHDLRARAEQQRVVAEIGTLAAQGVSLQSLMTKVVERVATTLEADCSEVLELATDEGSLAVRARFGLDEAALGTKLPTEAARLIGAALRIDDAEVAEVASSAALRPLLEQLGVASGIAVPIEADHVVWGALAVYSRGERCFGDSDTVFLRGVVNVIAAALEREASQRALAASERRYRKLFANIHDIYFLADLEGHVLDVSPSITALVGVAREELIGVGLRDYYEDAGRAAQLGEKLRSSGHLTDEEFAFRTPDGRKVEVSLTARLIRDASGQPIEIEGIARDITRRKRLEERLRTTQKLEALGELAGGVAHDFNNLLTGIRGFTELVLAEMPPDHDWARDLRSVVRYSERAGKLAEQLLAFSRKQRMRPRVVDLNEMLAATVEMLERVIGEHIELSFAPGSDAGYVRVDAALLEQALVNLAVNARDAMPDGGTLSVSTRTVEAGDPGAPPELGGGYFAAIRVADSGTGMDHATRQRIFEPFFTTKEIGRGTGLGLAMVYGIVRQHGGVIHVDSSPGGGAAFEMYLPLATDDEIATAPLASDAQASEEPAPRGAERILLVEDEEAVRAVAAEALTSLGYEVAAAADHAEAEALALDEPPFDLLLADVVLPHRSGPEIFRELRSRAPELRVLFISGYPDRAMRQRGRLAPSDPLLRKPFSPAELGRRVREVLDADVVANDST